MRKILITLDYELFFGLSGSVQKSIIEPTNKLLEILDSYNIKASFFLDSGFLIKLKEFKTKFDFLNKDYELISKQISKLAEEGHDIQLHIHPHWEDSYHDGDQWVFETKRYKLSDFSNTEITDIVRRYSKVIEYLTKKRPTVFRAGGWCIQPFDKISDALYDVGIRVDSTVYANGKNASLSKSFDFSGSPNKNSWRFSEDPLVEDNKGRFLEIPISSIKILPFFFFRFILAKFFGGRTHKSMGDGIAINNSPKQIFELLITPSYSVVSIDGYKSSLLNKATKQNKDQLILIGHPKAFTQYSLRKLNEFLDKRKNDSVFLIYSNYDE